MNIKKLQEYISVHGSDISKWPENIQRYGLEAQKDKEFVKLIKEEQRLENMLHTRKLAPHSDLAERIIMKAQLIEQKQNITILNYLKGLITDISLPAPVYSMAAIVMIGFFIGFASPSDNVSDDGDNLAVKDLLYFEETIL